jgi:hypothetical protein
LKAGEGHGVKVEPSCLAKGRKDLATNFLKLVFSGQELKPQPPFLGGDSTLVRSEHHWLIQVFVQLNTQRVTFGGIQYVALLSHHHGTYPQEHRLHRFDSAMQRPGTLLMHAHPRPPAS